GSRLSSSLSYRCRSAPHAHESIAAHRACRQAEGAVLYPFVGSFGLLVAWPAPGDLFISAKDLFIAAMDAKRSQPFDGPGQVKQSGSKVEFGPSPLCQTEGRTLPKWRSSPSEDLSDCAKELFAAASVITNW